MPRLYLSGPNGYALDRSVFQYTNSHDDAIHIGEVRPRAVDGKILWSAVDLHGKVHGETWLTDWYAADALTRASKGNTCAE